MTGSPFQYLSPIGALVIALLAAGCGSEDSSGSAPPAPLPTLAADALPGLTAEQRPIGIALLTHDAPIDGFAGKLAGWGFEHGTQREFTGRSPTFTNVVSRTLQFRSATGAQAYVQLVADRVGDFFGDGSKVRALEQGGRSGYQIRAATSGCHRETPLLIAVVSRGDRVSWLYANGPRAKPKTLEALLARAP
ncbi:MAG: hypothetical protein QOF68_674 [Gaiellales bacterium]|nr:hypothetical protein [Gaiellales bacterium]